jgi:hypothetical protein
LVLSRTLLRLLSAAYFVSTCRECFHGERRARRIAEAGRGRLEHLATGKPQHPPGPRRGEAHRRHPSSTPRGTSPSPGRTSGEHTSPRRTSSTRTSPWRTAGGRTSSRRTLSGRTSGGRISARRTSAGRSSSGWTSSGRSSPGRMRIVDAGRIPFCHRKRLPWYQ